MSGSNSSLLSRLFRTALFSGWLQFMPPFGLALALAAASFTGFLLGWSGRGWALGGLAALFFLWGLFDLIVIKLRLVSLPERALTPPTGDAFAVMRARRAVRAFQPRKLDNIDRAFVTERLTHHTAADSAHAIAQGRMRAVLLDAPLTVWPSVGAQSFIVVLGPKAYDRLAVIEAGRAVQHVVNEAVARGLATCWIGPGADHALVAAALGAEFDAAQDHILCVVAIGYESRYKPFFIRLAALSGKRRKPMMDLVFEEAPGLPAPMKRAPFKALAPALEAVRWAPSSYNSQTSRIILVSEDKTLLKAQFCATEGSRFYAPLALGIWCANWETGMEALGYSGRWRALDAPRPIAGDLVHDVTWWPEGATAP